MFWADQQHSESHILARGQAQFEDCPGICSFLNSESVPDVRNSDIIWSEILGNQTLLNISDLQNTMEKSNLCWELLKAKCRKESALHKIISGCSKIFYITDRTFINPQKIASSLLMQKMWICLQWVWLPPQGFFPPSGWLLDALRAGMGIPMPNHQPVPVLPDKPAGQDSVEPNKTVKIPPAKTWSDSKEPPSLILLPLPAKEHLPHCFNLQDPSYFNPIEKDWCFGVVLGYIKIHISNNKCFPFIQPSLFSMEPNFQAVSSTFQEYEAPFSSCANTVMPPIIYV